MKRRFGSDALLLACGLAATLPVHAQQTIGLFVNDERAYDGYTLFAPSFGRTAYLINNDGLAVRSWTGSYINLMAYLLENGDLLRTVQLPTVDPRFRFGAGATGRIEEVDWNGNIVWTYEYSNSLHLAHHDIEKLPNGNVLLVAWDYHTKAEATAAGRNPLNTGLAIWSDSIIEVRPTPPSGGEIVWEWHVWDHLVQDHDPTKANYGVVGAHPELVDVNYGAVLSATDWNHVNSVKYNAELDQIVLSSRVFSEFWVIDHSTTTQQAAGHTGGRSGKGGDVLYRWGNPAAYRRGTAADQKLFSQHDPHWIAEGHPGEGHFLVFNNGNNRPGADFSTVDELVPPTVDANGNYPIPPGLPYEPAAASWSYQNPEPTSFNATHISGAQRLPNGNTLICEGPDGDLFEVTPDQVLVWRYVSPTDGAVPETQGIEPAVNEVFKIRRYAPDHPGLADKDLTAGDPIEIFDRPWPVPEPSLLASRMSPRGDQIELHWNASSCPADGYKLLFGSLADVSSQHPLGAVCNIGLSGTYTWTGVPVGSLYFVAVGRDSTGIYESGWGHDSSGRDRGGTRASFQCGSTTKVVSSICP